MTPPRRELRARRRLAEFDRLCDLGVDGRAALVLAEALAQRWHLRGDTTEAYNRHRRHASPIARERHAVRYRRRARAAGRGQR